MSPDRNRARTSPGTALGRGFSKLREINEKYAGRWMKLTPSVRIALFLLRIYLLALVAILFVKFFLILAGK
ncbi:MAG TPA: hypothetical protein VMF59_09795 [Bacteroidota bacterium]|nr:hypothetical protein [Bacteroidota bacterium]